MTPDRVDWPAFVTDVAFRLAGNWRRPWSALQAALAADGLEFHRDSLRAIGNGRRRPSDPDLAVWLLRAADRLNVPIPPAPARVNRPVLVPRGTTTTTGSAASEVQP